jgi:hypothetical protein
MANWIASRCDNPSNTIIIDVKDEIVTTGTTVGVNFREGENFCFTLVEQTLTETTNDFTQIYDSCLECLINSEVMLAFKPCFSGDELVIPSNLLKFVPQIDTVYKLNLSITIENKSEIRIININDCYIYAGYVDTKPVGDIKFNSNSIEYNTCEECAPFKSAKLLFDDKLRLKVSEAREYYTNILSGITTTNV